MKKTITLLLTLLLTMPLMAQFSMDGQLRQRAEFRDGYRRLPAEDSNPAANIAQRTRLGLTYAHEDRITTRVSLQDLRIWGQEIQRQHLPSFGLYEAWVKLALSGELSVQAGRQELRYDNQRLMAINDWSPRGRSHDAVVLKYVHNGPTSSTLHVGGAFNQSEDRLFETDYLLNNYKTLAYVWYNTDLTSNLNTSLHLIADGYENPNDAEELNQRITWSGFMTYRSGDLQFRINPAFQHGKTAGGQDIRAFYGMLEGVYRFTDKLSTTAGFELFSGNDAEDPGDYFNAFDDLYGVGHGRNGFMDYFTNFPNHTANAGLINPYIKNNIRINERTMLSADLHLFFLQNNFMDQGEVIDKYLGTEIDLVVNYRFNDFTRILAGYSVMFGSESMEVIKGGSKDEFAHWAFLMLRITPAFF